MTKRTQPNNTKRFIIISMMPIRNTNTTASITRGWALQFPITHCMPKNGSRQVPLVAPLPSSNKENFSSMFSIILPTLFKTTFPPLRVSSHFAALILSKVGITFFTMFVLPFLSTGKHLFSVFYVIFSTIFFTTHKISIAHLNHNYKGYYIPQLHILGVL